MNFITFGNSTTLGDAVFDEKAFKTKAACEVVPEVLTGIGLRIGGAALLLWGIIGSVGKRGASALNGKTVIGAAALTASFPVLSNSVKHFEDRVEEGRTAWWAERAKLKPIGRVITVKSKA